jgi:hypothetical protein
VTKIVCEGDLVTVHYDKSPAQVFNVYRDWMTTYVVKGEPAEKQTIFFKNESGEFGLEPARFELTAPLSELVRSWEARSRDPENLAKLAETDRQRRNELAKSMKVYLGTKLGFLAVSVAIMISAWGTCMTKDSR